VFLNLLQNRRSIRKYKANRVEKEKIDKIIEAALRSPSSRGINPWQIIVIDDKKLIEKLSKSKKYGSAFLNNSPSCIVVCGDRQKSDVWIEDASIVSIIISLTAESLDLGSCWVQIRNRMHDDNITSDDYVRKILNIPENLCVESIISIGYADEKLPSHSFDKLDFNKVFKNNFSNRYF